MRRKNKEVADEAWMKDILRRGQVVHIGLASADGEPYVVPMGYGYEDGAIYIHGATAGLKNDIILANPRVAFNVALDIEVIRNEKGAEFSMQYRSVSGWGRACPLTGLDEKNRALAVIMRQYDGPHTDLTEQNCGSVWVARVDIETMRGKISGYPHPGAA